MPLLLAMLAGVASAQAQKAPFHLETDAAAQDVLPGRSAIFHLRVVNNDAFLARTVNVTLDPAHLPAGWTYTRDPAGAVEVPAGGNATLTLAVNVPEAAPAGGPHGIVAVANETGGALASASGARLTLNVTVLAPASAPPAQAPETQPPRLTISARDATARPGTNAVGSLAFLSEDDRTLEIEFDIIGPASWSPSLSTPYRIVTPGQGMQYLTLYAAVPPTADNATTQVFTVQARARGETLTTEWTVKVEGASAAPALTQPTSSDGSSTQDPASGEDSATPPSPSGSTEPGLPGLRVDVASSLVETRLGEAGRNTAIVDNTGATPLTVRLEGSAHATWGVFVFDQETLEIPAGGRRTVDFTWDVPEDILPQNVAGASVTARGVPDGNLVRTTRFDITVLAAAPADLGTDLDSAPAATISGDSPTLAVPATWGAAAGLGAVGVGALALARRPWREKFLWGAAGLYTRLARPDVLGHDEREKLYRLIEEKPGIHFHALQRQLGWNTGTLTYHVRVLERHGFVVSRRDGLYRRFYLQGAAPRKETFNNDAPTGLRADVLEAIRNQHGLSQADLALALGANKQTVNYHVKALERAGTIVVVKRGRETFLYPSDAAPVDAGQASA